MTPVVVGQVIGVRRVLEEQLTLFRVGSDDQRIRFGGAVRGKTCHEDAGHPEYWRTVVPMRGLNVRQRPANLRHKIESTRRAGLHATMVSRSSTSDLFPF